MSTVKVQISVLSGNIPPRPSKKDTYKDLCERIEYAVECIECDEHKEEAIQFLQNLHGKLLRVDHPREEHQILIDKIKPVLGEYGSYHLPDGEEEEEY
jgi:fructose-1-phosphate kinase PfkB-like protein